MHGLLTIPLLALALSVPAPTGFVNDFAGVVADASRVRIETMARNFRDRTSVDVAVVTVRSLEGRPIEDVSLEIGRSWGIGAGSEKDVVVVLLAVDDRKPRIEVNRKLDDEITDGTAGTILRAGRPFFSQGDYGKGLEAIVERLLATIADRKGVSIAGIDAARAVRQPRSGSRSGSGSGGVAGAVVLLVVIFVIMVMVTIGRGGGTGGGRRRRRRSGLPWILPFPIGGGWGGGSSHGGWGSGGGSWGGGGGSWGGFGGGGDFGGGGASDSW